MHRMHYSATNRTHIYTIETETHGNGTPKPNLLSYNIPIQLSFQSTANLH